MPPRSVTAVLGASGSGKTTLLRVIAGFERPQAGHGPARPAGWSTTAAGTLPPERRRIGYVPQEAALFPHLTVAGNVAFGLRRRARGAGPGRRTARAGRPARPRPSLPARAVGRPAAAGGAGPGAGDRARRWCCSTSRSRPWTRPCGSASVPTSPRVLREPRRPPVVLVTHDQQEAISLADQVAVLRDGRVAQAGPPAGGLRPAGAIPALAAFLGAANLVTARRSRSGRGHGVRPAHRDHADPGRGRGAGPPRADLDHGGRCHPGRAGAGDGLTGRVTEQSYQGHETLVTVCPDRRRAARARSWSASRDRAATRRVRRSRSARPGRWRPTGARPRSRRRR